MNLAIASMPLCGFGNRLLYYYNLRQEASIRQTSFFCNPWDGHEYFEGNMLGTYYSDEEYQIFNFCLGEKFFIDSGVSTREVFKLKHSPIVPSKTCAIHFRGTDFHSWNPKSILKGEYYCDSIDLIKDKVSKFVLFTDDVNLKSFVEAKNHLDSINAVYFFGENNANRQNYINDFSYMTECDWIISSPSTYGVCAGFIGKNKKIIHSKEWLEYRIHAEDKFWCDLSNGGNKDYELWRIV